MTKDNPSDMKAINKNLCYKCFMGEPLHIRKCYGHCRKLKNSIHTKNYRFPWYRTDSRIRHRCDSKNGKYRKRGIKNFLGVVNLRNIWFRDNACQLKKPSIDRVDNNKHYTVDNSRYIEMVNNKFDGKKFRKPIVQYTAKGRFIKTWDSITEAGKKLGILRTSIANNLTKRSKFAGGYIWKYKQAQSIVKELTKEVGK